MSEKKPTKRANGRPTKYNKEIALEIYALHSAGYTMNETADMVGIHVDSIYEWEDKHPEFSEKLDRARKLFVRRKLDKLPQMIESRAQDEMRDNQGRRDIVGVKRDELITGLYKWLAEKRLAKEYGNKVTQEHTGADGAALIPAINVTIKPNS